MQVQIKELVHFILDDNWFAKLCTDQYCIVFFNFLTDKN